MNVFFFHYNKPASKSKGKPQISIHYRKQCLIVDNIDVRVPTFGHIRNVQPFFVMKGKCNSIIINKGLAIIN